MEGLGGVENRHSDRRHSSINDRFTVTPDHVAHSEIASNETQHYHQSTCHHPAQSKTETKSLYVAFITGTRGGVSNTFCLSSGLRVRKANPENSSGGQRSTRRSTSIL
jgi:hypothetical protein